MPRNNELEEQEFSHFFNVNELIKGYADVTIEASEGQAKDVARRVNINEIKSLTANLKVQSSKGSGLYHVKGALTSTVIQECVVTLDPVETKITEDVEGWFADRAGAVSFAAAKREREGSKAQGEVEILDEKDDPEPLIEGHIDLGELVTQHLSLAIPPYPHKEGVEFEVGDDQVSQNDDAPYKKNPFEALKDWKEKR